MKTLGRQTRTFHFIGEVKAEQRNGVAVGIIEGYASTWSTDRGDDVILRGAFAETIQRHKSAGRPVRMLFQHSGMTLIGGFPPEYMKEDEHGLYVRGEINLTAGQMGEFAYSLAKQGVLTDMSVGFSIPSRDYVEFRDDGEDTVRVIKKADLWEISLVGEPMNTEARIIAVKSAAAMLLPIAERDAVWDMDAATLRVKGLEDDRTHVGGILIADVVDGELKAIPKALFSAAAVVVGAKHGDVDNKEISGAILDAYYSRMNIQSPITADGSIDASLVESVSTMRDAESLLKYAGLSRSASKMLISKIKSATGWDDQSGGDGHRDDAHEKALLERLALFNQHQSTVNLIKNRLEKQP